MLKVIGGSRVISLTRRSLRKMASSLNQLSTKGLKKFIKPTFEKNPELYYPIKAFEGMGFTRAQCPACKSFYWSKVPKTTCGDSK